MNRDDVRWVRRRTICGTSGYRPPEQLLERFVDYYFRSGYDERADWFSLGVCCYTMLTGKRPFCTIDNESKNNILNDAEFRCPMFEINFPQYFENEIDAKNLLRIFSQEILKIDPASTKSLPILGFQGNRFVLIMC